MQGGVPALSYSFVNLAFTYAIHFFFLCDQNTGKVSLWPSYVHSFSSRRKRIDEEKGGRPKLPFLWECPSLLNGRNSLRSNKTPIFNAMPPILIVRQAAQPVIPVTGRLGSKCEQLRMNVCWKTMYHSIHHSYVLAIFLHVSFFIITHNEVILPIALA